MSVSVFYRRPQFSISDHATNQITIVVERIISYTMKTSFTFVTAILALIVSLAAASTPEGLAFLATKKTEEGVVELPSGLLYKEIRAGTGKTPTVDSPCSCHYAGTLLDGTEFDSSYKRGAPLT